MNAVYTLAVLVGVLGTSLAWMSKYEDKSEVYDLWPPVRRSGRCKSSGEECLHTTQCCERPDVCVTSYVAKGSHQNMSILSREKNTGQLWTAKTVNCTKCPGFSFGKCQTLGKQSKFILKEAGQECSDSSECQSMCCRIIRKGRYGYDRTCGSPWGPFMCIKNTAETSGSTY